MQISMQRPDAPRQRQLSRLVLGLLDQRIADRPVQEANDRTSFAGTRDP